MKRIYLSFFTLTFFHFLFSCTTETINLTNDEISAIDSVLYKDVPVGAPGLAIGIVQNGQVIYEKYAGYANLTDSTLLDQNSRFNIASNGKQFTAFTVLTLLEQGKLDLDDNIQNYLPEIYSDKLFTITIRDLINHTSGIRDVYDLWALQGKVWWEVTSSNADVIELLSRQQDLNFEPGTEYSYSNSNYILLTEIVARVTGKSFRTYSDELFNDLGMVNTSFESDHKDIRGEIAEPYFNFDSWFNYDWITDVHGDGALFSTLPDQLKWESIIQTNKSYPLSADLIEISQKPIQLSEFPNYGYGLEFGEYNGHEIHFHLGATGALKAVTYRFPKMNLSIVVLTNSGKVGPEQTTKAVADIILGIENIEKPYLTAPAKVGDRVELSDITGTYQYGTDGGIWKFEEREGELFLLREGRNDTKLIRESDNVFQQWNDAPFKQEFTLNEDDDMQVTAYYHEPAPFTLTRINSDFTGYEFESLSGSYHNEETGVGLTLNYLSDKSYEFLLREEQYQTEILKPDYFRVAGFTIIYEEGDILFNGNRNSNVRFRKSR